MKWKRDIHKRHGTTLLETYSYQSKSGLEKALEDTLREHAEATGCKLEDVMKPVSLEHLFDSLKEQGQITVLANLFADFLNLYKTSSCRIKDLADMRPATVNPRRYELFLNIFQEIVRRYTSFLDDEGSIDFGDMIKLAVSAL